MSTSGIAPLGAVVVGVLAAATERFEALPQSAEKQKAWSEYLDAIRAWRTQDDEVWRTPHAVPAPEPGTTEHFHEVAVSGRAPARSRALTLERT
jgi:hypothetical protein